MASEKTTIEGEVRRVHGWDDSKPGRSAGFLCTLDMGGEQASLIGSGESKHCHVGMRYRFYGRWDESEQHGKQFRFESYAPLSPLGKRGVVKYLQRAHGIGPIIADKIWAAYGDESIQEIIRNPQSVADRCGISSMDAKHASEQFRADENMAHARVELLQMLDKQQIPGKAIERLIEKYGISAPEAIRRNPYILWHMPGVGWKKADSVYIALGGDPDSPERCLYALTHAMTEGDRDGHTWRREEECEQLIDDETVAKVKMSEALKLGEELGLIVREGGMIAERKRARQEADLSKEVARLMLAQNVAPVKLRGKATPHQRHAFERATSANVGILVGSPGTGKSLVSNIADCASCVLRIAPTGKAASHLTGGHTIHSYLGARYDEKTGSFTFTSNARNRRIGNGLLIVDEAFMIGSSLMYNLLSAVGDGMRVLFVGDDQQLPPIGHGAPLRDMMASGVFPVGRLTEIHRNSDMLAEACVEMRETGQFRYVDNHRDGNLIFLDRRTDRSIRRALDSIVDGLRKNGKLNQLQIICAVNERTRLSRKVLNAEYQKVWLGNNCPAEKYNTGDKVICLKNCAYEAYSHEVYSHGSQDRLVAVQATVSNGDIGTVSGIFKNGTASVSVNGQQIRVPCHKMRDEWDLGYAISCHKAQGASWPYVAVVLDDSYNASFTSREWLYTAISRAEKYCWIIGRPSAMEAMLRRESTSKRITKLAELLKTDCAIAMLAR